jgi:hypothetical protein
MEIGAPWRRENALQSLIRGKVHYYPSVNRIEAKDPAPCSQLGENHARPRALRNHLSAVPRKHVDQLGPWSSPRGDVPLDVLCGKDENVSVRSTMRKAQ